MSRRAMLISGILCLVLLAACSGYRTTVTPTIAVSQEFNDNVYASSENPESDFITSITPGLTWAVTNPRRNLSVSYSPSFNYYAKTPPNFFLGQNATLAAVNYFSRHTSLEFNNTFSLINDPFVTREIQLARTEEPQRPSDNTRRNTREPYYTNSAATTFRYAFGPDDSFLVSYLNSTLQNEDPTVEDSTSQGPSLGVTYWLSPRYGIDAQTKYTHADFSLDTSPFDEYELSSRFIRRFTPQFDTFLKYVHTIMDFHGGDGNSQDKEENYQIYETTVGLDYHPSQTTFFSLSGGFFIQDPEETKSNAGFVFRGDMAREFNWGAVRLSAGTGYRQTYLSSENLGFTKFTEGTLAGTYKFTRTISGNCSTTYTRNSYEDEAGREDNIVALQAGLSYLIRPGLLSSLSFTHQEIDSNVPGESFDENLISLSFTFTPPTSWVIE